ncbi:MAG: 4-hydroxythreonine-4-phosphate dehydrogenase PdxA [Pseudomonadota bacterium]
MSHIQERKYLLSFTAGEPAGIGPDLAIYLAQSEIPQSCVIVADPEVLHTRAKLLNLPVKINIIEANQSLKETDFTGQGQLLCLAVKVKQAVQAGCLNVENSAYVLECIKTATELCLSGYFDGLVTGPIHKGIINQAGLTYKGQTFIGHTEYLAQLSQTKGVIMMLATEGLRVSLVTTHLPLKDISAAITKELLSEIISLLDTEMKNKFGINNPHIAICGLNPHAGEGGHLGNEEIDTIIPVIKQLQQQGLNLSGPIPADTIFTEKYMADADTILAMYHDQGLPVLKYKGFGQAVNITLGLPFIRTSVDHGTALDLAGSRAINSGSMFYAIKTACTMLNNTTARNHTSLNTKTK